MFQEKFEQEYIVMMDGTSEGTQIKYKKDNYWYKKDCRGKEGLAEYLVSGLLTYSDLEPSEYVVYEKGTRWKKMYDVWWQDHFAARMSGCFNTLESAFI